MPLKDDSIKILKYMLLLYVLFYILEKGRALHEPSVLCNLLHVLLKRRRSKVLSRILTNFPRSHKSMNAIFFSLSLQTHSQHYSISSCAYSSLHNKRRLLLSRSFRASFWRKKNSFNADFTLFPDSVHVCNHGTVFSNIVGLKWRHINLTIFFSTK